MIIFLDVDAIGPDETLRGVEARMRDLSPVFMRRIDRYVRRILKEGFRTQGAAFGQAWAPLAPSTVIQKRKLGVSRRGPMRRSDRTFKSLTENTGDTVLVIGPLTYQRGTSVPWFKFGQEGTDHQPARQQIPDPPPQYFIDEVRELMRDYILRGTYR